MSSLRHVLGSMAEHYLGFVHVDRRMALTVDLGPMQLHLPSETVSVTAAIIGALVVVALAVFASRRSKSIPPWRTWIFIAPIMAVPLVPLLSMAVR